MNCYFQLSWCQVLISIFIFKDFQKNEKRKKFSLAAELRRMAIFANFTLLQVLPPNEWIFTFQSSWCQVVMFSFIFKGFKKWSFDDSGSAKKMTIWLTFAYFASKWVKFCISDLLMSNKYSGFPAFSKTFQKLKKIEDFDGRRPAKNHNFC